MLSVELVGGEQVITHFKGINNQTRASLKKAMLQAMVGLRGYVAGSKLSGQVLNVRTGTLRRSITQSVTDTPEAVTGIVGTNISYAAAHEYGFTGDVSVRAHLRQLKSGTTQNVGAYMRHVKLPERSFLRSSLREQEPSIREQLAQAIVGAANGHNS